MADLGLTSFLIHIHFAHLHTSTAKQVIADTALEKLDYPSNQQTTTSHHIDRQPSYAEHIIAVVHIIAAGTPAVILETFDSNQFAFQLLGPSSFASAFAVTTFASTFIESIHLSFVPLHLDPFAFASFTEQQDRLDPSSFVVAGNLAYQLPFVDHPCRPSELTPTSVIHPLATSTNHLPFVACHLQLVPVVTPLV